MRPQIVESDRVHGGVATGVSQALYEEFIYDAEGMPMTTTFVNYAFPSAADLPSWETIEQETPTPANPLGAKGVGELCAVPFHDQARRAIREAQVKT